MAQVPFNVSVLVLTGARFVLMRPVNVFVPPLRLPSIIAEGEN